METISSQSCQLVSTWDELDRDYTETDHLIESWDALNTYPLFDETQSNNENDRRTKVNEVILKIVDLPAPDTTTADDHPIHSATPELLVEQSFPLLPVAPVSVDELPTDPVSCCTPPADVNISIKDHFKQDIKLRQQSLTLNKRSKESAKGTKKISVVSKRLFVEYDKLCGGVTAQTHTDQSTKINDLSRMMRDTLVQRETLLKQREDLMLKQEKVMNTRISSLIKVRAGLLKLSKTCDTRERLATLREGVLEVREIEFSEKSGARFSTPLCTQTDEHPVL